MIKSLSFKRRATVVIVSLILVSGVAYQARYDQQKIHYSKLVDKYDVIYDEYEIPDYLVLVYTQWIINGAGQGRKRKAFLDAEYKKSGQK